MLRAPRSNQWADSYEPAKTAIMWEYKIGNDANIANFVCLWKTR